MAKKVEVLKIKAVSPSIITVHIVGDTDLVLNKMNDRSRRKLTDDQTGSAPDLDAPNMWEDIITSLHWIYGKPNDFTEAGLKKALKTNAPCLSAFGLKKSFGEAVVRLGIDKYSTKFDASVNILAKGGLVPITFAEHFIDEKLMSPKGSPILSRMNRFSGWSADIQLSVLNSIYSVEQLVNIINLAGFGIGIGSGRRSCGYGRYHIEEVK